MLMVHARALPFQLGDKEAVLAGEGGETTMWGSGKGEGSLSTWAVLGSDNDLHSCSRKAAVALGTRLSRDFTSPPWAKPLRNSLE